MIIDHLVNSPIFRDLSIDEIESIAHFCDFILLEDGVLLLQEDDEDYQSLFLLVSGSLEIVSNKGSAMSDEVALSVQEKDLVGDIAWLTKQTRIASVRTRAVAEIVKINGAALDQFIEDHPKAGCTILRNICVTLCERMKSTNTLLTQLLLNHGL